MRIISDSIKHDFRIIAGHGGIYGLCLDGRAACVYLILDQYVDLSLQRLYPVLFDHLTAIESFLCIRG